LKKGVETPFIEGFYILPKKDCSVKHFSPEKELSRPSSIDTIGSERK